jgi:xylulokinase
MSYLMGIDVGTTGTRCIIVDEAGHVIAGATGEHAPISSPQPLWAEQDPADWWRACILAIRQALATANVDGAAIKGIGLSGQMHGVVLLDKGHKVLRPCLMWCDQRSQAQCDWIHNKVGYERTIQLTCNPALTGFSAPKLLWVRDNEPKVFAQARTFLLPKDYIRFRLTGDFATEVSDASGTVLFDVAHRVWSKEMLAALDLDASLLPPVYESPVVSTAISASAAEETGLKVGTPVVGGGGDQASGGVGNGIVQPGIVSSTIGTSGVVFAFSDKPVLDPKGRVHTFCHAVPGQWHMMGVTQGAGLSLRWFRDNFGNVEMQTAFLTGVDTYDLLSQEAARAPVGSEGLIFLPYMMGERTPHLDPNAKGVFFGLTGRQQRFHVVRAILEGVAYSLRDSFEIFGEMGVQVSQVRASGGGGRSELWRQIQADVFGREIVTINATEGPAYGVALLAGVGTGVWASVGEACSSTIRVVTRQQPVEANVAVYESFYSVYRALYPALKPYFDRVTELVV